MTLFDDGFDPDDDDAPDAPPKANGSRAHKPNGKRRSKRSRAPNEIAGRPSLSLVPYRERAAADVACKVIAEQATHVYQRGGMLVRVVAEPEPNPSGPVSAGAPRITQLPKPVLRETLDELFCITAPNKKGEFEATHPPDWFVSLIDARGEWPVRRLEMVVQCPMIRPDGTVIVAPGYDAETGLLYEPNYAPLEMLEVPLRHHALAALDEIKDIVCDFPFVAPKHLAGWVALALTPFARMAFRGPTPLGVMDGSVAGVGKGKLVQAISIMLDGCEVSPMPQATEVEEERKLITSIAIAAKKLALIDNITKPLGSGPLEALLTATRWSDRVLGANKTFDGDCLTQWFATGNNIAFRKKDTIRRSVHVRVESKSPNPEAQSNWTHDPLLDWVRRERPRLVRAALTILRAHALAGYPNPCKAQWGSFEGWSDRVRAAVVWLGMDDPADTRSELAASSDTEGRALVAIVEKLLHSQALGHDGVSARALLGSCSDDDDLKDAIEELCPTRKGDPTPRALAYALRSVKGRVVELDDGRAMQLSTVAGPGHSVLWCAVPPA